MIISAWFAKIYLVWLNNKRKWFTELKWQLQNYNNAWTIREAQLSPSNPNLTHNHHTLSNPQFTTYLFFSSRAPPLSYSLRQPAVYFHISFILLVFCELTLLPLCFVIFLAPHISLQRLGLFSTVYDTGVWGCRAFWFYSTGHLLMYAVL